MRTARYFSIIQLSNSRECFYNPRLGKRDEIMQPDLTDF